MKNKYLYIIIGLICCINTIAVAQKDSVQVSAIEAIRTPTPNRYFTVGISANGYKGSLSNRYASFSPGLHLGLQFNKKKRLNGSFQLFLGQVSGDNLNAAFAIRTDNRIPNSYFKTSLFIASYQLNLNLVNTKNVRWYAGTGFGITRFNVRDDQDRNLSDQPTTRAIGENYNNITLSVPLYMGINYHFVNGLALALQAGWWNTNTPFLDNIDKLGSKTGNDNVASYRLSLWIPFQNQKKQVK